MIHCVDKALYSQLFVKQNEETDDTFLSMAQLFDRHNLHLAAKQSANGYQLHIWAAGVTLQTWTGCGWTSCVGTSLGPALYILLSICLYLSVL